MSVAIAENGQPQTCKLYCPAGNIVTYSKREVQGHRKHKHKLTRKSSHL